MPRDPNVPQGEASASSSTTSGGASPSETADVAGRQLVYDLVASRGRIGEAVSEVSRIFTRAPIDSNPGLGFKIKVCP